MNTDVIRFFKRGRTACAPRSWRAALAAHPLRMPLGALLTAFGTWLLFEGLLHQMIALWSSWSPQIRGAAVGGAVAATATALGTLPILFTRGGEARRIGPAIGFSAGVMLAASLFSLLVPAYAEGFAQTSSRIESLWIVTAGAALGVAALLVIDVLCAGLQPAGRTVQHRTTWLFVLAIVLHNVPEGLSIGVGYAGGDLQRAHVLAGAIAIQDLPEGLVVALAVRAIGWKRGAALAAGAASGLVEWPAAVVGSWLIGASTALLPWALAGAAGAMLFAISRELAQMLIGGRLQRAEALMLLSGFAVMTLLDNVFGQ